MKKQTRIWVDGCFDMMHFGHANALRQAKTLGDYLIVGVHSDADILEHKGPTVMNEKERYAAVAACKWVDEVVEAAPYVTELKVLEEHNVDFVVHGDDLVTDSSGRDTYHEVKAAGKFRIVRRTKGVSTTDLVGRMLLLTKTHFLKESADGSVYLQPKEQAKVIEMSTHSTKVPKSTKISHFIPLTSKIVQFSSGREAAEGDKIVYVDGAFDLFHLGHIEFLKQARKLGDYVIVGVHSDKVVNGYKGSNWPIMNLHERVLGVLSCRYVDEVVMGAPLKPSKQFLEQLNVNTVMCGTNGLWPEYDKCYTAAKEMGIWKQIDSPSVMTTDSIVARILKNYASFEARNKKKEEKEVKESGVALTS